MKLLRRILLIVVSLAVVATVGVIGVAYLLLSPVSTVGKVDFDRPLAIPPMADSRVEKDGTRVFELTAQAGSTELIPGTSSETWGFNGSYLGPTLRAERGEDVRVEVDNELDEDTSVHWHGMHLPPAADGGPHQPVPAGDSWTAEWTVDQPAASLWYHPHPHGETEEHVDRGLAGMFILDDPNSRVADRLPNEYGVDDVPLIVQDKRIGSDGDLQLGGLGDDLLVNGTYGPHLDVTTEKVRLRLLNGSTKRVYDFGFSDGREFAQVGSDGGLLPEPVRTGGVQLSPGERAEVVVDMSPGETVVLRSNQSDLGGNTVSERFNGGEDEFDVLELRAAQELDPSLALPEELAPAPDLDTSDAKVRTFEMLGREINGKQMDMSRIDETVELGATEIWEVENVDSDYHNFHVHDVQFQVLSVDGRAPGPQLSGWKDTIFMPPGRNVRLAMQFTDYADPDVPYMYHCHLLQHEDRGMMGQFVVVEPGQEAGEVDHADH